MIIAFCHAGSDKFPRNHDRSTPIDAWRPLWDLGHEWWSVLKGGRQDELVHLPPNVRDRGNDYQDALEQRVLLHQADLLITVDTMTANLAGRYKVPTWVLLSAVPDWRYGLTGDRSPIYPTLRLFRQTALGDWSPVFAQVAEALATLSVERAA